MAKAVIRKPKKKVCQFCKEKATGVDYKDTTLLRKFISDRGKIRARRVTGNCVQHQRDVAIAVKNAREVALLPYTSTGRNCRVRGQTMKLILTQEVDGPRCPRRRRRGQGRLRPQLPRPRGVAIRWTRGAQKTVESIKQARASRAVRDHDHAGEIKKKLESAPVSVKVRSGEGGRLFGAVTVAEIAGALADASGEQVDKRTIAVKNPIKSLGSHVVLVRLHDEVSATVALNVIPA